MTADYYSELNVSPNATHEEIQAAYRKLALAYHPDRHSTPELQDLARVRFAHLQEIYEVLSDAHKRRLYDTLGEEGLKSGFELAVNFRTPESLRAEFERLAAKKAMRDLESKIPVRLSVEAKVALWGKRGGLRPWLRSMTSQFGFQTTVGGGSLTVGGAIVARDTRGIHNLTFAYRKSAGGGNLEAHAVIGSQVAATASFSQQLTETFAGAVNVRVGAHMSSTVAFTQQLMKDVHGRVGFTFGDAGGLRLRYSHALMDQKVTLSAGTRIGISDYDFHAKGDIKLSERSSITFGVRSGHEHVLEAGILRRMSKHAALQCVTSIGDNGVLVTVRWHHLGQILSFPIIIDDEVHARAVTFAVVAPILLGLAVKYLVIEPRRERKRLQKLERVRKENEGVMDTAKREAANDIELMRAAVARRIASEESRNGLIILKAFYGKFEGNPVENPPPPSANVIDVTVPVQFLVENSALQLFHASKHALPGFYDVAIGEKKRIYVLYRFKGKLHEVMVADEEPLTIPVKRDLLPDSARRVW